MNRSTRTRLWSPRDGFPGSGLPSRRHPSLDRGNAGQLPGLESAGIAGDIAIITVAALLGGLLAHRLRLPVLLGYIFAGIVVGPNTGGPTVVHFEDVEVLADIGVALLLFTVGLEFPVERLAPVRRIALIGTPIQLLATAGFGFGLGRLLGWDWQSCSWLMPRRSSTMVVLKLLADRGLTGTCPQSYRHPDHPDLAVILMLILLPAAET